ncbi:MAG: hypothetical protein ACFN3F_03590, partial [Selenomonas sp.]
RIGQVLQIPQDETHRSGPGVEVVTDPQVELITPIAIEKGLRFAIREGGHTVGAGRVTEIEG